MIESVDVCEWGREIENIHTWVSSGFSFRYRLQTVKSLAGVSLMLRLLWASLRWDDMAAKAPPGGGTTRTGKGVLYASFHFQEKNHLTLQFKNVCYLLKCNA